MQFLNGLYVFVRDDDVFAFFMFGALAACKQICLFTVLNTISYARVFFWNSIPKAQLKAGGNTMAAAPYTAH